jgi:hypothetical protein
VNDRPHRSQQRVRRLYDEQPNEEPIYTHSHNF